METTKHTPGPWIISTHDDNNQTVIRDTSDAIIANLECDIFRDYGMDDEEHRAIIDANAKLIVAAPEMLEALENIFFQAYDDDSTEDDLRSLIDSIRSFADTAIKKATQI
jgi:hypothetical protein